MSNDAVKTVLIKFQINFYHGAIVEKELILSGEIKSP